MTAPPWQKKTVGIYPPWRGSLLPLGCEAVLIPCNSFLQTLRSARFYGGRAAERKQAPSPQGSFGVLQAGCRTQSRCLMCARRRLELAIGFRSPVDTCSNLATHQTTDGRICARMSFYGGCVWEIFGSAGFLVSSVCEPAHSYHPIRFAATGSSHINTVTNISRILLQDVRDVFGVIELRGFEAAKEQ